jgi:hypothetical protein
MNVGPENQAALTRAMLTFSDFFPAAGSVAIDHRSRRSGVRRSRSRSAAPASSAKDAGTSLCQRAWARGAEMRSARAACDVVAYEAA